MSLDPRVVAELRKALPADSFLADRRALAADFGGAARPAPGLVVVTRSERELRLALEVTRAGATPVVLRGAGHSCGGQTLNPGGVVLLNFDDRGLSLTLTEDGRADVSGRSYWHNLERRLNRHGAASPVLTDYLDLTVGGTLSVGGYGLGSLRHGAQVDNVAALRLLTPDGGALWCSPEAEPELFRFALAGLGQVGVIERAVLDLVEHPPRVFVATCTFPDTAAFLRALGTHRGDDAPLPDAFNAFGFGRGPWYAEYGLSAPDPAAAARRIEDTLAPEVLRYLTRAEERPDYVLSLHRSRAQFVEAFPGHLHVWGDYVLDYEGYGAFLEWVTARQRERTFQTHLGVVYCMLMRARADRPRIPLAPSALPGCPPGALLASAGLYYMVPPGDGWGLICARRAHEAALERCVALGGRPYRYGANALGEGDAAALYGEDYRALRALKARVDPQGLLNPGVF